MIEVVRGATAAHRDEILAFWETRAALIGEEAEQRVPQVVCLLREDGEVAGVSSVFAAEIGLIGGRRFWIYRSLLRDDIADQRDAMLKATFEALDGAFDHEPASPIGLCLLIADPEERRRRPEAVWTDPTMLYAGYLADGRQVRIGYFNDADISRRDEHA